MFDYWMSQYHSPSKGVGIMFWFLGRTKGWKQLKNRSSAVEYGRDLSKKYFWSDNRVWSFNYRTREAQIWEILRWFEVNLVVFKWLVNYGICKDSSYNFLFWIIKISFYQTNINHQFTHFDFKFFYILFMTSYWLTKQNLTEVVIFVLCSYFLPDIFSLTIFIFSQW